MNMDRSIGHLTWGVSLFCLYIILSSMEMSLLKICDILTLSQSLALIFVGELASMAPISPLIWRNWSLVKPRDYAALFSMCTFMAAFKAVALYSSHHMFLGRLLAIHTCIMQKMSTCINNAIWVRLALFASFE